MASLDDYWIWLKMKTNLASVLIRDEGSALLFDIDDEDAEAIAALLAKEFRTPGKHMHIYENDPSWQGQPARPPRILKALWMPGQDAIITVNSTSFGAYEFMAYTVSYAKDD